MKEMIKTNKQCETCGSWHYDVKDSKAWCSHCGRRRKDLEK